MTSESSGVSRRRLLVVVPGALAALSLSACAKTTEPESCTSTLGLTQEEIKIRTSLGYVDRSNDANKYCIDCLQYVPPPEADECGTCKVMKGPAHPKGSCNVFTPKR